MQDYGTPVNGGTSAPPKKSRNQMSMLTSQKVFRKGIGKAATHARTQLRLQILSEISDSYPPVIAVMVPPDFVKDIPYHKCIRE
jgi:hypothetical protein